MIIRKLKCKYLIIHFCSLMKIVRISDAVLRQNFGDNEATQRSTACTAKVAKGAAQKNVDAQILGTFGQCQ